MPLPDGSPNAIELQFGDADSHDATRDLLQDAQREFVALRPQARGWIAAYGGDAVLDIFKVTSATDLAFLWLRRDLKRVGWYTGVA